MPGPSKKYDILGLKMIDSAELRVHPTGKAILKLGVKAQGQGHETTFAQIVADELGIPVDRHQGAWRATPTTRRTASAPTPRGRRRSAARRPRWSSRKLADKAKKIAAHLLEAADADIELENGTFSVRGHARPVGHASRTSRSPPTRTCPTAWSTGSKACTTTTRRTSPIPYGSYVVVVEVDAETGVWKVQRMVALDDCGVRINPMIVEGQIHGGLTEGFAMSSMQWITFDEDGNCIGSNFMDYLDPDRVGDAEVRAAARRACRRRTTRSAPRASASRPRSARRPRTSTR